MKTSLALDWENPGLNTARRERQNGSYLLFTARVVNLPVSSTSLQGGSVSRSRQTRSLILDLTFLRQNIGPRLTAHQNDQHGKPEEASEPESAIRTLVSCARAKRGRDGARRSGEAGRASSKFFFTSHQ